MGGLSESSCTEKECFCSWGETEPRLDVPFSWESDLLLDCKGACV